MQTIPSHAMWIVPPDSERSGRSGSNEWFMYRAKMEVADPAGAVLRIAADSKYWLHINGQLMIREGGLKRGPLPEGTYCDEVDVSRFLHTGTNTVAVLLWYFGRHGFSHRDSGTPGLLMDAVGMKLGAWRVKKHPAYFDAGYVRDAYRLSENSVGFDGRDDVPDWTQPGFDDAQWPSATLAGEAGATPWGVLEKREFPQWLWSELKEYESVETKEKDGFVHYRCKLPHNAHFIPALELHAEAGLRIDMEPTLPTNRLRASYITKQGRQAYESNGWMNGEEVVYKVPGGTVQIGRLAYRETGYPAVFSGSFSCDNAQLNTLWKKARRTLYVTMRDNFMDCPCRERAQWPGDLVVQLGQVPYCLGREADLLVKKGLRETLRWQLANGELYGPVPEGNWRIELPSQMLAVISPYGIWTYYMNTADRDTLEELYPFAKRYLDIWKFQPNGLIRYRPDEKNSVPKMVDGVSVGTWDWIDWGEQINAEPALNAWFVLAAKGVQMMAKELGLKKDVLEIRQKESGVISAIRQMFWNEEKGGYVSEGFGADPDDRVQALMVLCGAADAAQYPQLKQILGRVEEASPFMEKYILEALFVMNEPEAAIDRMQRRYASMASNPDSTLWERWPEWHSDGSTTNHSWSGGPLTLLSQRVAGFQPLEPGWKRVAIRPAPCGLKKTEASIQLPQGVLELSVDPDAVRLSVPPGTEVLLDVPTLGSLEPLRLGAGAHEYPVPRKAIQQPTNAGL